MSVTWIRLFDERHGLVLESSRRVGDRAERLVRTDDAGAQAEVLGSRASGLGRHIPAVDHGHSEDHGLIRGGRAIGLHFTDAENGWFIQGSVVTEDAVLSRTSDGGSSWQHVTLPQPAGDPSSLSDIEVPTVFPDGTVVVSAFRGFLGGTEYAYRSSDGGRTWTDPVRLQPPPRVIAFVDSSHWWRAAGSLAARTSDGGGNWHPGGRAPDGLMFTWLQPVSQRSARAIGVQAKADLPAAELLRERVPTARSCWARRQRPYRTPRRQQLAKAKRVLALHCHLSAGIHRNRWARACSGLPDTHSQ